MCEQVAAEKKLNRIAKMQAAIQISKPYVDTSKALCTNSIELTTPT
jgi:hypothetical protein